MCVCPFLSLFSLSFFLSKRVNYIPFIHSQERSAFGCVALERRGKGGRGEHRVFTISNDAKTDSSSFFVFLLREERERGKRKTLYNTSKVYRETAFPSRNEKIGEKRDTLRSLVFFAFLSLFLRAKKTNRS